MKSVPTWVEIESHRYTCAAFVSPGACVFWQCMVRSNQFLLRNHRQSGLRFSIWNYSALLKRILPSHRCRVQKDASARYSISVDWLRTCREQEIPIFRQTAISVILPISVVVIHLLGSERFRSHWELVSLWQNRCSYRRCNLIKFLMVFKTLSAW